MQTSLLEQFERSKLRSCYFHLVKAWWSHANKQGLRKKNVVEITKLIIQSFKMAVHIDDIEIKKSFIKDVNRIFFIENFWDLEKEMLGTFASFFDKILELYFTENSFFSQFIDYG